jgi:protein phosphatase
MSGQLQCHGATHVGQVRPDNQDQFLIADLNKSMRVQQTSLGLDHQTRLFGGSQGKLLVVADGMGGHASGERASTLAVDSIATYLLNTMPWLFRLDKESEAEFERDLQEGLRECQRALAAEVQAIPQRRGMGTTVTLAYILWPRLYVVHVGDSRCYLFRGGELKRLTRDHTLSQFYADLQGGQPTSAENPAWSNVLWNVVGGDSDELTIDLYRTDLALGDALLLCTDGLTKHVPDERLADSLSAASPPAEVCNRLIDVANQEGGTDNITVVVAKFLDRQTEDLEETAAVPVASEQLRVQADTDPFIALGHV